MTLVGRELNTSDCCLPSAVGVLLSVSTTPLCALGSLNVPTSLPVFIEVHVDEEDFPKASASLCITPGAAAADAVNKTNFTVDV